MSKYKMIRTHSELEKGKYEVHNVYHIPDVLNKFDRLSFIKNVRHAAVRVFFNSDFFIMEYTNKEAISEIKEIFSNKNLTNSYYDHKIGKYAAEENLIGFSLGGFHLKVAGKKIYTSIQLSFEVVEKKAQFVLEFNTYDNKLHLEGASINSTDIDEFVRLVGERINYLTNLHKELQEEYGKKYRKKQPTTKKPKPIAPKFSMDELEAICK